MFSTFPQKNRLPWGKSVKSVKKVKMFTLSGCKELIQKTVSLSRTERNFPGELP
jgi:hypothetical protein